MSEAGVKYGFVREVVVDEVVVTDFVVVSGTFVLIMILCLNQGYSNHYLSPSRGEVD